MCVCVCVFVSSNQSLPSHHLSKEDAQRGCSSCALVHTPQVKHQGEVNEGGDGRPGGVESQTVLDLDVRIKRRTGRRSVCAESLEKTITASFQLFFRLSKSNVTSDIENPEMGKILEHFTLTKFSFENVNSSTSLPTITSSNYKCKLYCGFLILDMILMINCLCPVFSCL